ncbi:MAG: TorF family putative porin [Akkermansiaceae bacterium]
MLFLLSMNNKIRTTILGGLLSASIASPALAGDFSAPIETVAPANEMFSFGAGYHSTYLFRGINFGDDMVDASLEATTTLGCFDLTAGIWTANVINPGQNTDLETDVYLNASKDLGFATLDVGYILYYFDRATSTNTQEVYLGLSKEVAGFGLSATYYYDFDQFDVSYLELGVERSFAIGALGELDAALAIGINPEDSEFTHAQATISKSIELNSAVSLTPYVSYSYAIEDVDSNGTVRDDEFVAGASIGFSF